MAKIGHNQGPVSILLGEQRDERINAGWAQIYHYEKELTRLREEMLKPIAKLMNKEWRSLKAEVDIDKEELNIGYQIYRRKRMADDFENESDTARVQAGLKAMFEALRAGETLDFIDMLIKETEESDDQAETQEPEGSLALPAPEETGADETADASGTGHAVGERDENAIDGPEADWGDDSANKAASTVDAQLDDFGTHFNAGCSARYDNKDLNTNPHPARTPAYKAWARGWKDTDKKIKANAARQPEASPSPEQALNEPNEGTELEGNLEPVPAAPAKKRAGAVFKDA